LRQNTQLKATKSTATNLTRSEMTINLTQNGMTQSGMKKRLKNRFDFMFEATRESSLRKDMKHFVLGGRMQFTATRQQRRREAAQEGMRGCARGLGDVPRDRMGVVPEAAARRYKHRTGFPRPQTPPHLEAELQRPAARRLNL
jgi:hypothetical protein